jgi:uncharacterized protein with HEPN domain
MTLACVERETGDRSRNVQRYVSDMDFETFEDDEEIIDAVIHNLTVIGEAAHHIPSEITGSYPDIPWRHMSICGISPFMPTGTFVPR